MARRAALALAAAAHQPDDTGAGEQRAAGDEADRGDVALAARVVAQRQAVVAADVLVVGVAVAKRAVVVVLRHDREHRADTQADHAPASQRENPAGITPT